MWLRLGKPGESTLDNAQLRRPSRFRDCVRFQRRNKRAQLSARHTRSQPLPFAKDRVRQPSNRTSTATVAVERSALQG